MLPKSNLAPKIRNLKLIYKISFYLLGLIFFFPCIRKFNIASGTCFPPWNFKFLDKYVHFSIERAHFISMELKEEGYTRSRQNYYSNETLTNSVELQKYIYLDFWSWDKEKLYLVFWREKNGGKKRKKGNKREKNNQNGVRFWKTAQWSEKYTGFPLSELLKTIKSVFW